MSSLAVAGPARSLVSPKQARRGASQRLRRRDALLELLAPAIINGPVNRHNLQAVADQAGVSMWVLRGHFGNFEGLIRAVWEHQLGLVLRGLTYRLGSSRGVLGAIRDYAAFVAAAVQGEDYRGMLVLLIRYGETYPWPRVSYERHVCRGIREGLERAVQAGGRESGRMIVIKEPAAVAFHKRIETELATVTLIPPRRQPTATEVDAIVAKAAAEAFEATYLFDWHSPRRGLEIPDVA